MSVTRPAKLHDVVDVTPGQGDSGIVLVCEHASSIIPADLKNLGMTQADRLSHAAWDPGALAVARHMAQALGAPLVAGGVSRLVYDCNRPPEAQDAMPAQSERITVPGNVGLDAAARAARTQTYYAPFRAALAEVIAAQELPVIVTIHSFTPIFHGQTREVQIGVLHDSDARLADAMLAHLPPQSDLNILRNAPYGPQDGVTHTLKEHAVRDGHLNVMIEIRNDLIATGPQQTAMAAMLVDWIRAAMSDVQGRQHA